MTLPFDDDEIAYLEANTLARLATVDRHGFPQNNPVGFRLDRETGTVDIYGFGMERSRKYRNIRHNPAVAFVVDGFTGTLPDGAHGIEVRGHAEAVTLEQPPEAAPEHPLSAAVIRIHPHRIFTWGIPGHNGMTRRDVGRPGS